MAASLENVIYSNLLGIQTTSFYIGEIANNLIYANLNQGVLIDSPETTGIQITSNTIYQTTGDGVDIEDRRAASICATISSGRSLDTISRSPATASQDSPATTTT